MNELAYQRLIIKAVVEHGGAGWKQNNRFLVGVPDLLLQVRGHGTSVCEVKKTTYPYDLSCGVKFKLSKLQHDTLKNWENAGGIGGVIVIATRAKDAFIAAYPTSRIGDTIITVQAYDFIHLDRGKREKIIVTEIQRRIYVPSAYSGNDEQDGSGQDRRYLKDQGHYAR